MSDAEKCQSSELKTSGKYGFCRLKAEAKAVKTATTPDYSKCDSTFSDKFGKANNVFPATDPAFNTSCAASCTVTSCSCTLSSLYWSSTTYQGSPNYAWFVNFNDGTLFAGSKPNSSYVRAVRGGS